MALPKIDSPVYELELPLSKKKIKYRPFLVKEQKNLLLSLETDDTDNINTNIRQILTNCTMTQGVNVDDLPLLDIEYYFLNLRARSVGEIVESRYRCNNMIDGLPDETGVPMTQQACGNIMETQINLLDIKIDDSEMPDDIVRLTDNIHVKLKYPSFSVLRRTTEMKNAVDIAFELVLDSIDIIYDGDEAHQAKDSPIEEVREFLESLNKAQFEKIQEFIEKSPRLNKTLDVKCNKCGFDHVIHFEGLESFFD